MTQNKILKILKDIRPEFNFKNNNDYFKSGLLDSLDIVILVENLEKEFQIKIAGEEIIPKNFSNLKKKIDSTGMFKKMNFNKSKNLNFTKDPICISKSNFVIVCLPTPVDRFNKPDLSILLNGTKLMPNT